MESTLGLGKWFKHVPFEVVPKGFIEQIFGHPFTYEEYLGHCPEYNALSNIWNIGLIDKNRQVIAFQYGHWDPLARHMELTRLTIQPKMFRIDGKFLLDCLLAGKELARLLDADKVYWITCHWKSLLRKLDGYVKLADAQVMEVY